MAARATILRQCIVCVFFFLAGCHQRLPPKSNNLFLAGCHQGLLSCDSAPCGKHTRQRASFVSVFLQRGSLLAHASRSRLGGVVYFFILFYFLTTRLSLRPAPHSRLGKTGFYCLLVFFFGNSQQVGEDWYLLSLNKD
jgi:hypothetical protein